MQIFLKGWKGVTRTFEVEPNDRIFDLMQQIENSEEKAPIHQQRLIWSGKQLDISATFADAGVKPESTIHLCGRARGGMFHQTSGFDSNLTGDLENQLITLLYRHSRSNLTAYYHGNADKNTNFHTSLRNLFQHFNGLKPDSIHQESTIVAIYDIFLNSLIDQPTKESKQRLKNEISEIWKNFFGNK